MADKAVTLREPTGEDVEYVQLRFEDGQIQSAEIALRIRVDNDSSGTVEPFRVVSVTRAELSVPGITALENVISRVIPRAVEKLGFSS